MLAVKGLYENGKVILEDNPPIEMSEVVVVFSDNDWGKRTEKWTIDEKKALFDEFSGSVNREINWKEERLEALDEKY